MGDPQGKSPADRVVIALALALLALVLVRTAWLCDDAYITLRVVDNLVDGHGLTWNVGERVQTYTHPLWLFLLAAPYYLTREHFLTTIGVSMLVSLLAAAVLAGRVARATGTGLLAVALLVFSRAFVDYSSSGLENPLTHLLLVLFFAVLFHGQARARNVLALALLAALGALNRIDTLPLYAPGLVAAWWRARKGGGTWPAFRATAALACGMLPLIAWEVFSLVYYGFPFPNTFYAKLGAGISSSDLVTQGLHYVENCWRRDPLTLGVMAAGMLAALLRGSGAALAGAFGIAIYLLYVVRIGGDFMAGRFFSAPFVCGVALLTGWTDAERARTAALARGIASRFVEAVPRLAWAPLVILVAWIGLGMPGRPESDRPAARATEAVVDDAWASPTPTVFSDSRHGKTLAGFKDGHGIGDERLFYFANAGLLRYRRNAELPMIGFATEGRRYRLLDRPATYVHGSVGFRGYFAGPKAHIIDYYALTDPLLARLPAVYSPNWRVGHFVRNVPPGYVDTEQALHTRSVDFGDPEPIIAGPPWRWPIWRALACGTGVSPVVYGQDADATAFAFDGNEIEDMRLAAYYDQLILITRGPILARERWRAIWRMNTGGYDHLIDQDAYRYPGIRRVVADELPRFEAAENDWKIAAGVAFTQRGIEVALGETRRERGIEIALDGNDKYRILVVGDDGVLVVRDVGPSAQASRAWAVYEVALPERVAARGYAALRVFPVGGDRRYRLGWVRPAE